MTDNNNFNPIKDGESIYLIDYVDQFKNELKVIKIKCNQNQIIPNNLKNTARYVSVIIDKDNAIKCEIIKDPRLTHIKKLCDIKVDTGKSALPLGSPATKTITTPSGYPIYGKSHVSKITPIIMTGGQRYDDELDEDELDEYYDEETTDEEEPDLDLDEDEDIDLDEDEDIDLDLDLDEYDGISLSGGGDEDSKQIYRREKPLKDDKEMFNRLYQYRKSNKENRKFIGDFINAGFDKDDYEYLVRKPSFKGIPVNIFDIFNNKDDIEDVKLAYNLGYTAEELFEKGYKDIGMLYEVFDDPDDESLSRIINKYHYGSRVTRGVPKYLGKFADAITGNFDAFVSTLQKLKEKNTPIQGLLSSGQISKLDESTVDKLLKAGYTVKDLHDYGLTIDQIFKVKGFRKQESNSENLANEIDDVNKNLDDDKYYIDSKEGESKINKILNGIRIFFSSNKEKINTFESSTNDNTQSKIKNFLSKIKKMKISNMGISDAATDLYKKFQSAYDNNTNNSINNTTGNPLYIGIGGGYVQAPYSKGQIVTNKADLIIINIKDESGNDVNILKFAGFSVKEIVDAKVVRKDGSGTKSLIEAGFDSNEIIKVIIPLTNNASEENKTPTTDGEPNTNNASEENETTTDGDPNTNNAREENETTTDSGSNTNNAREDKTVLEILDTDDPYGLDEFKIGGSCSNKKSKKSKKKTLKNRRCKKSMNHSMKRK